MMTTENRMTLAQARAIIATEGMGALAARLGALAASNPLHAVIAQDYSAPETGSGPLAGIPIGVKDNIDAVPFATTGGSPAMAGYFPAEDAGIVARIRAAGAWVPAKLNLHEFAFGITSDNGAYGAVLNPYDDNRTAGGSSGGSGAAVAAGIVPAAIGTDTGASVRIPASFCGVVGLRPSTGRYSTQGVLPISWSRDTPGFLANCVADVAELDAVAAPTGLPEPVLPDRPLRLGLAQDARPGLCDKVEERFDAVLADLAQKGIVEVIDLPALGYREAQEAYDVPTASVESYEFWSRFCPDVLGLSYATFTSRIGSPDVQAIFAATPDLAAENALAHETYLRIIRPQMQARHGALFAAHGIDALIAPTCPVQPAKRADYLTITVGGETRPILPVLAQNVSYATYIGCPSLSLPAGLDRDGLPVGLLLDGLVGADRALLEMAARIEAALA
ncbi:amidase family protein [Thioclava sp. GXIMD2076]|uniref:amidase family protein n=1 Tax=Thioclava sp. GXIMD2076 TaxID=3131931 RepID=UPI0030CCA464